MRLSKDILAGTIILFLVAVLWSVTSTFDEDPLGMAQGMPATHMPRLVLMVIAGLTVIMMAESRFIDTETIGPIPPWQVGATVALLGLAAILFPTIGVPAAFFGVCVGLPILWGNRNYIAIAIFAVCVPAAIYILFKLLLGLRLPMGPLSALGL